MDLLRSSFRTSTVQRVTRNAWVRCFHFWQRFDSEVHPTEMAIWRRRKLLALACTSRRNMVLSFFHAKFHVEYFFPYYCLAENWEGETQTLGLESFSLQIGIHPLSSWTISGEVERIL